MGAVNHRGVMDQRLVRIAVGSIAVGIIVLGLKLLAWKMTGSVALYSDALESIVNVVTAVCAFVAIRLSSRPADAKHQYGHEKVEYFSAVIEGVMIVIAAIAILREAWFALQQPRLLDAPWHGLLLNAAASVLNGLWCVVLLRTGKRQRSPALTADGWHLFSDVVTSIGVLAGIILAIVTGWAILDPALAAFVALNILWSGWKVISSSLSGLMDEALPEPELKRIRELISSNAEGAIEAHDLRTRLAGRVSFVEFHLVVPALMTVTDAHAICDRIEHALREAVEGVRVTIHVEPENKAKHTGVVVL